MVNILSLDRLLHRYQYIDKQSLTLSGNFIPYCQYIIRLDVDPKFHISTSTCKGKKPPGKLKHHWYTSVVKDGDKDEVLVHS